VLQLGAHHPTYSHVFATLVSLDHAVLIERSPPLFARSDSGASVRRKYVSSAAESSIRIARRSPIASWMPNLQNSPVPASTPAKVLTMQAAARISALSTSKRSVRG